MTERFLLYGATGYTGKMVAQAAVVRGIEPVLCGRDERKLRSLAEVLQLEHRVARLDDRHQIDSLLSGAEVVLNCAGPFTSSARLLADACIRTHTHYLDVTGELHVFESLAKCDAAARLNNVMLMPGVGFAIVPSDCLAAYVTSKLRGVQSLHIGVTRSSLMSRGSFRTLLEQVQTQVYVRRNGRIVTTPLGSLQRRFDFGQGQSNSLAVSWPDIYTAFYATGVENITAYIEASPIEQGMYLLGSALSPLVNTLPVQVALHACSSLLSEGPEVDADHENTLAIVVEAEDRQGRRVSARLRTPNGYQLTVETALAVVQHVQRGELQAGFQTPARVYGPNFILGVEGVVREDLGAEP